MVRAKLSGKMVHRCSLSLDLEDHSYEATTAGKERWQKYWKIVFNPRVESKIRQQPRLYKEHVESTGHGKKSIHPTQQKPNSQQPLDEHEEYACTIHHELDGDVILQQVRLHPHSDSRTMNGSRDKVGIIGDLQPGLNSKILKVEITSLGKPVAQVNHTSRSDSDSFFLASNFQFPSSRRRGVNRTTCHIACTVVSTVSTQHIALACDTLTRGSSSSCAFQK